MKLPLVILTGASGSGKTTLARHIQQRYPLKYKVFFFDSIGVPPAEQIAAEFGSGEAWPRAMTLQWMKRIAPMQSAQTPVLLEGQMRIAFIQEALHINRIENAHIVLVDCDDATRTERLRIERSQHELANQ